MPFLLCNILIAFSLFFDLSSLTFCSTPWLLCLKNPFYAYIYAGCVLNFSRFTSIVGFFSQKRRVVFTKTTCCFHQNDVLFSSKRRVVFTKTTCCFLCTFWCEETSARNTIHKPRFWTVKTPIQPSLARTRTRALQEFFSFCCHKCHTVIDKVLYSNLLWVFLMCSLTDGCFKRRIYAGKDNDIGRFFRFYSPQNWLFFHQRFR